MAMHYVTGKVPLSPLTFFPLMHGVAKLSPNALDMVERNLSKIFPSVSAIKLFNAMDEVGIAPAEIILQLEKKGISIPREG